MTYRLVGMDRLGVPDFDLASNETVASVPVGTIVRAFDDAGVLGHAEFIYLPGVASCVAGDCVVYDLTPGAQAIVRTLSGTHLNTGRSVAWALNPCVAGEFGWFQISGIIVANGIAGGAIGKCMLTTTAGCVDDTAIAGCQIGGALVGSAYNTPAAGKVYVVADRPRIQTQIT